jgi:hypothetical protein
VETLLEFWLVLRGGSGPGNLVERPFAGVFIVKGFVGLWAVEKMESLCALLVAIDEVSKSYSRLREFDSYIQRLRGILKLLCFIL